MKNKVFFIICSVCLLFAHCNTKEQRDCEYHLNGKLKKEIIPIRGDTSQINIFDTLGNIKASYKKLHDTIVDKLIVYYPGTKRIKGKVFYEKGERVKIIIYSRNGKVLEEKESPPAAPRIH
jgi:antitoxin component YwqK of YwqJK toxin-antitoxin module